MNAKNRSRNTADELARAEQALQAAELLTGNGFHTDAVSKLYYYLLYHVRALLLTKGLEPKSHEGAIRLLAQHFEKDGPLPHGSASMLAKIMKFREEVDYNAAISFTREDYLNLHQESVELANAIRRIIDQADQVSPAE